MACRSFLAGLATLHLTNRGCLLSKQRRKGNPNNNNFPSQQQQVSLFQVCISVAHRCCTWIGLKKLYNLCFPVAAVVRDKQDTGIMMDSNTQEKVHEVEEFFYGHLKPQLVRAIAERDKVFEQQKMLLAKEHRELREEQRTMVNLGSVLYMQADVPDTHRIFVDVGLGFHVEFTWQDK